MTSPLLESYWQRYDWLLHPLLALLVTRLLLIFAGYTADIILPNAYIPWEDDYPESGLLETWARNDSLWYMSIVIDGYSLRNYTDAPHQSNLAFFPLYPALMRGAMVFTSDVISAGVLVSLVCLYVSLVLLYQLTQREFGDRETAQRAVFYLAAAPMSYFFSAIYSESTFLMFTLATFFFAREQRWMLAGLAGMCAGVTRITGIAMLGVYTLEWLRANGVTLDALHRRQTWRNLQTALRHQWVTLLPMLLIPIGLLAYMLYLDFRFFDASIYLQVQRLGWARTARIPFEPVWDEAVNIMLPRLLEGRWRPFVMVWLINWASIISTTVISLLAWRRLGAAYGLYPLVALLVPLSSGTLSFSRFTLVMFPVVMMLAHWGRFPPLDRALLVGSALLLGVFGAMYVNWGFLA